MSSDAIRLDRIGVQRGQVWPIEDVSWTLPAGVTAAVLGANGSGKSTLLRVLGGYLFPTRGSTVVCGFEFGQDDLRELKKRVRLVAAPRVGGVDEWDTIYDGEPTATAGEIVQAGIEGTIVFRREALAEEVRRADAALARCGVGALATRRYGALSTGERTRVQLARALVNPPELLLLDEPALGLDVAGREALLALLDDVAADHPEMTRVVVTHHVEDLPTSTSHAVLLRDGKVLAAGLADDVLTSGPVSEAMNVPVRIDREMGRWWLRITAARRTR